MTSKKKDNLEEVTRKAATEGMAQRRSHQTAYDIAKAVTRAFLDDPESVVNDPLITRSPGPSSFMDRKDVDPTVVELLNQNLPPHGAWKHWKEYGMTDLPLDMIYPYRDDKVEKKRKMTVR